MSDSPDESHVPVLLDDVLSLLQPAPGGRYIDCTVGSAGHAAALLEASAPGGRLLALDADPAAIEVSRRRLAPYGERAVLAQVSFDRLGQTAPLLGFHAVQGILFDLGLSSRQLASSGRGFAFRGSEPLDMRFDPTVGATAADLLNQRSESELEAILRDFGEERQSRRIARAICRRRARQPLESTDDLVAAVYSAVGPRRGGIHPATRTFQALRIAVNGELEALQRGLEQAVRLLAANGRIAVIAFHSLEDRIVKRFLIDRSRADAAEEKLSVLTRKPIVASPDERNRNPHSRSAKLRVAERAD